MTKQEDLLASIDNSLQRLLRLEVEERLDEQDTVKEKVLELHGLGFDTKEMADLIGTSPATVRSARSSLRDEGQIDD